MNGEQLFQTCLAVVHHVEGGKANRPLADDPGGATMLGISLRFLQSLGSRGDLDGDGDVDADDIDLVTPAKSAEFYRSEFWQPCRCDMLPPELALLLFDAAVNHGQTRAVKLLQAALQVDADGRLGPKTLAAAHAGSVDYIASRMMLVREDFMRRLKNWEANKNGWRRRLFVVIFMAGIVGATVEREA